MNYLLLWLEGPLQAWGHDSKFGLRDTLDFPTKSGVLGLILASMGKGGEQSELLDALSSCKHYVYSFCQDGISSLQLIDYQVVGSGYDETDELEQLMIPRKRDGNFSKDGKGRVAGSKLTYRHYIQDGKFAVIAEIPSDIADEVAYSLQNPVWPLFLGRRTCIPTKPIFRGLFNEFIQAESSLREMVNSNNLSMSFRVLEGRYENEGDVLVLNDVPLSFGENKKYSSRYVTVIKDCDGWKQTDNQNQS